MQKMTKIILCVTNDLSTDQRMQRICNTLHKNDYKVTLIGREKKDSSPIVHYDFNQVRIKCFLERGPFFYIEFNIRLFFYLLINRFDIVCANDVDTLLPCALVKMILRKKGVYDSHEYFTETPELHNRIFAKAIWRFVEKRFATKMDLHYTVNDTLANELTKNLKVNFYTIRNVPLKKEIPIKKSKENIIVYQGVLNQGRGLEASIDAMSILVDYQLWIIGSGDIEDQLKNRAKALNNVKFFGKILPSELDKMTCQAKFGLNLLENKSLNYYYSLANKFFDYLQLNVPSINMNFPEYETFIHFNPVGLIINKLDSDSLINAIRTVEKEDQSYEKMEEEIQRIKSKFTWEIEELKLLKLYHRLK
jgi:glycosyltransferase involved in cell wall biosynthesis